MTEIRLLGAVEVVGSPPVGSTVLRTLLAQLALEPGRPVTSATLIDELYGEAMPKNPSAALQVQVTRLRKWVAPAVVASTGGGYVLHVGRAEVDLARFLDAPPDGALACYGGEAFPGCRPGSRLAAERHRVERRHLDVVAHRARALLAADRPDEAAALCTPVLARQPDREELAALTALAQHRIGRASEALQTIATTRRRLRTEHGTDPGHVLRAAERTVLEQVQRRRRDVVGRAGPLTTIREALGDPVTGRVLVVAGEAGIGKSTLLGAALDEAARRGAIVGRGLWEHDQAPFAAWQQALHAVGVEPPSLRDPAPGRTLRRRLAAAAADGLVLVALDDAHRADTASLDVLRGLGRAGLPPGVVVLLGVREPDTAPHPAWSETAADLALLDGVGRIALRELDEPGTRALVGDAVSEALVHRLWERTGGHPLHLSALLAELKDLPDDEARERATGRVPERLRPLLAHQLGGLPERCRHALEVLAVLGPLPLVALAAAAGLDERALARDLRPAVTMTLAAPTADGFAFRHELTAAAVLDTVPAVEAAHLHRAHLEAPGFPGEGADPFAVLRHTLGAAALLPRPTVADAHLPAARAAYRDGALPAALSLLEAAGDTTRPVEARLLRGLVLEGLGRVDEAADLYDDVVADPTADVAQAVAAAMGDDAQGPSVVGRPRRLDRLSRVRELPLDDLQRARVLHGLVVEQRQLDGLHGTAALEKELFALGEGEVVPLQAAEVAVARSFLELDAPVPAADRLRTARRASELARSAGATTLRFEADELLVAALVSAGQLDEALALSAELGPEAERRHRPRTMWATRLVEASSLLAAGKVAAADEAAQDAFTRGHELGVADALGAFGAHLVAKHLLGGNLPVLGGLPARTATDYPLVPAWAVCAAVDAVQDGDPPTAAVHLAEFHRRRRDHEGGLFDRIGLCLAACAAFALSDVPTAEVVLAGLPHDPGATVVVGIGAAFFGPVDLYRGLALAALGDRAAAHERFCSAAGSAASLGWTPWADAAEGFAQETGPGRPPAIPGPTLPLGLRGTP